MGDFYQIIQILILVIFKQELAILGFFEKGLNPWLTLLIVVSGSYFGLSMIYLILNTWPLKKIRYPEKIIGFSQGFLEWLAIGLKRMRKSEEFRTWEKAVRSYRISEKSRRENRIVSLVNTLRRVGYLGLAIVSIVPVPALNLLLAVGGKIAGLRYAFLIIGLGIIVKLSVLTYTVYFVGEKIAFMTWFSFPTIFWGLIIVYIIYFIIGLSRHIAQKGGFNNFSD